MGTWPGICAVLPTFGEKDRVREWFDKAVPWMEQGEGDDAELKRVRAETAELLGLKKKD
jgi:hypothetical protein